MSHDRWNASKNIRFINEYRQHECLWDPKHSMYKNRLARDRAYKAIMETMAMETVRDVVYKIRVLRNTYNNEFLKVKKRSLERNEEYVSRIPWLSHMDFIKNVENDSYPRTGPNNDGNARSRNVTDNSKYFEDNTSLDVPPDMTEDTSCSESEDQPPFMSTATPPPPSPDNKRQYTQNPEPLQKAADALEKISSQLIPKNDEFGLFGQTIAEQLRQLPLDVALETEEMIMSTLRKQRIKVAKGSHTVWVASNPLND